MDKKKTNDLYLKWVDLIEECIKRMANNSFVIKNLTITIVVATISILPDKLHIDTKLIMPLILLAVIPFWYIDSFYLYIEKLFREKYNEVVKSMNKNEKRNDMLNLDIDKTCAFCNTLKYMFNSSTTPLYLTLILISYLLSINLR